MVSVYPTEFYRVTENPNNRPSLMYPRNTNQEESGLTASLSPMVYPVCTLVIAQRRGSGVYCPTHWMLGQLL